MTTGDDDLRVRPGRVKDGGAANVRRATRLAAQVRRAAMRAGSVRRAPGSGRGGTGALARGRRAALSVRSRASGRRVVIKARVVRQTGTRFRAAPLARHIAYLERDGVTRDGKDARMFDARSDQADADRFAERCGDDRHHFRFIVSPEDAAQMDDLRAFTRELMADVSHDLGTRLDWVAVDHWNTDNPHVHVLVRGVGDDGRDLVIDRDYIRTGMRARAEERATLELGPRSEREIRAALGREVEADHWTSLDRNLQRIADDTSGVVDLAPHSSDADPERRRLMIGRAMKLERLGLADRLGPASWSLKPGLEPALRDLGMRGDIIKTMHRAMTGVGRMPDPAEFAVHGEGDRAPVLGRLVERGLHDELQGTAYAVVDGADGRTHHLRFDDIDMTGDARPGAVVELRAWDDARGRTRLSLATRSDLPLDAQISAPGATWLDRQLIAREPVATGGGFGSEIRDALAARAGHLVGEGLARRQGQRFLFAQDLIETLRARDLGAAAARIAERTGLAHQPSAVGDLVTGVYRERLSLASGRFAMIDNGLGFQLVPWRPALDQHLGAYVSGTMSPGGVDWSFGRQRGLGL